MRIHNYTLDACLLYAVHNIRVLYLPARHNRCVAPFRHLCIKHSLCSYCFAPIFKLCTLQWTMLYTHTVHTFFQTIRPADCVLFTCIDRNQPSLKSVECAYCTDLQLEDNNNLKTMSMFCYRWLCNSNQVNFNTSSKKNLACKLKIEFASGFLMTAAHIGSLPLESVAAYIAPPLVGCVPLVAHLSPTATNCLPLALSSPCPGATCPAQGALFFVNLYNLTYPYFWLRHRSMKNPF